MTKRRYYWDYELAIWMPRDWEQAIRDSWNTPGHCKAVDRICYETCAAALGWLA